MDPLVSLMKVEKVPDSTYDMVGGLDQQIKEIKEASEGWLPREWLGGCLGRVRRLGPGPADRAGHGSECGWATWAQVCASVAAAVCAQPSVQLPRSIAALVWPVTAECTLPQSSR